MVITILIILILLIVFFKLVLPYIKGAAYESWATIAVFCVLKKIQKEGKDEKLNKAILNFIFSSSEDEKDEEVVKFTNENLDAIENKAVSMVSSNPLMHGLIAQTLFVKLGMSAGYGNSEMRDRVLANPFFKSFSDNITKFKPYSTTEYRKLVESFAEKENISYK